MIAKIRLLIGFVLVLGLIVIFKPKQNDLPLVAIANYGPHASLDASIRGVQDALREQGFVDNKTVRFEIKDVGFDPSLIPQMIATLKSHHPQVMVVLTTPVAQFAKGSIKDIPLIYDAITDPIEAGLIQNERHADANMTGSSDKQNLDLMLHFAKELIPNVHTVGLLYAPSEANDVALLHALKRATARLNMQVFALPVGEAKDVSMLMPRFKGHADVIYVGASGPIQPTLPVISAMSQGMHIPVINVNESAVQAGQALASFGVDYHQVGVHAGELASHVLKNKQTPLLAPVFPTQDDHHAFINVQYAQRLGLQIPASLGDATLVN